MNIEQQSWGKIDPFRKERLSKKLEKQHAHKIIENHFNDYEIYFYTTIFKNNTDIKNYKMLAHEYFEFTAQTIDALTLPNYTKKAKYALSTRIIMYPENVSCPHYHGYVMINKAVHDRFERRCITSSEYEYNERLERDCLSFKLSQKILYPYRENFNKQPEMTFRISSYKLNHLDYFSEIQRVHSYSTKQLSYTAEYTSDDIIYAGKCSQSTSNFQIQ